MSIKIIYENQVKKDECIGYIIDRKNKKFEISTSMTKYKFIEQPWLMLFDKGNEEEEDKKLQNLSDNEFIKEIDKAHIQLGYKRVFNDRIRQDSK